MLIEREKLLLALQAVIPGLSKRDMLEHSSCFVFSDDDKLQTYNDEIACSWPSAFGLSGAIQSGPLLGLLHSLTEQVLDITQTETAIRIRGKGRRGELHVELVDPTLLNTVEQPTKWRALPERFIEAVSLVKECAGKDDSQFKLTCVHVHPRWIEACDNYQLSRYTLNTGFLEAVLVRQDSIKHVINSDVREFAVTENWLHFRSLNGLVLSCRRYLDAYPDITQYLEPTGTPAVLPKSLADCCKRTSIFTGDGPLQNDILVHLENNKLRIKGANQYGWWTETKKIKYSGKPLDFRISHSLLTELVNKHTECLVTKNSLQVRIDNFVYATSLSIV